ncbi:DUF433 domain-containing protein [Tsuneonella sp. SYSU-LHT278]|uniref:DUF433 domain-containing protein n=1 Tax=Tsuneonella sediminis TaxID=3416089 RepID=UPI003F7AAE73
MSDEGFRAIGAFSAEQAQRLSGVSLGQLRSWHRNGFLPASFADQASKAPFSRIYSFKDIVTLRVLHQLRNVHEVSMPELKKVAVALSDLGDDRWTSFRFWVHNRKVVFAEPDTRRRREITSKQYIAEMGVDVEVTSAHRALTEMNRRGGSSGHVSRAKFVQHRAPVVAGTRVPVEAIKQFAAEGFSVADIKREYPSLSARDIRVALGFEGNQAA